ncbi:respiratory supercomplex assembly factor RCF1 Ecym_4106 [Eremothecium cymbalariae DBVPG|uniref:Respiratory supercomplex factor 1, mitochondrial n=1 Tax=Eremothecium cymbalariae (strain CBS 270.75 / DBVPG 7215 / KCTC 17166 / NRRL Y-17582) TaxID=931890 RepID=G8JT32_ERECY|nr:hypothetical protein Ecym_4106 [Eremothecium cymbalariae DBVPG\
MSYLPSSFDGADDEAEMDFYSRMIFNCKQQPLVPLGTLLTTGAVILAVKNLRSGNKESAQKWFRMRVAMQASTLVALVAGSYFYGTSKKEAKAKEEVLREKAKMREKLWIRELERRDEETQMRKKRAEMARLKAQHMEKETSKLEEELRELESATRK